MPIIDVSHLTKSYEYYKKDAGLLASIKSLFHRETLTTTAVDDISFSIEEGEFVGFLGPNGAGKTTTLKMLSGILHPTSGEISVLGFNPSDRKKEFQKQFAIVMGQKNQLWWDLPAVDSFELNKEIYEIPDKEYKQTLAELTDLLDIAEFIDRPVRKLSLGQRMKAELVAALLHSPRVLFLDEPTIGLDVVSQQNIREFLKKYNREKKTTIMLTSHYMDDVEALAQRVIMIDHGKKIFDGPLDEMIANYVDSKILDITFTEPITKTSVRGCGEIVEFTSQHVVLAVPKKKVKLIAAKILRDLPVDDILINEENLESVVRKMFAK